MTRLLQISVLLIIYSLSASAQKKNPPRDNNVRSVTEYKQDIQNNEPKVKESYVLYDKNGNVLEEIEYDSDGKAKYHMKYQFDVNNNKIKEIELNSSGKIVRTTEYKYSGNLRTEKNTYDGAGKLKTKRTYQYELQK
ncbi:MAG TPA: hypothetical protein VHO90_18805 [Bacteroidales bacterium]|nr:hypothetical protein [Bacteroidales bacterium]